MALAQIKPRNAKQLLDMVAIQSKKSKNMAFGRMIHSTYKAERQAIYRWRSQVKTHLRRLDELLAARPAGRYGELPEVPRAVLRAWRLVRMR